MKKLIVLLFVCVLMIFGCKNSETNETTPTDVNGNEKEVVKGVEVNEKILKSKLSKEIFSIDQSDGNGNYEFEENEYGVDNLLQALNELDKDKLKYGIIRWEAKTSDEDPCFPVLKQFCIDNNIDLFTKLMVSKYVPPEEDFASWAVKSTKTQYNE